MPIVRPLRDRGLAILFVSHRLEEVFDLCERATVFRDGKHVITAPVSGLTTADLIRQMVGRDVSLFPQATTAPGDVLLEARGLSRSDTFQDISFSVRAGEIVGFAGLIGAGRTEVARAQRTRCPASASLVSRSASSEESGRLMATVTYSESSRLS